MKIENSFRVDLPVGDAWITLLDIPGVVPCMPGAELLSIEDERTYRGQMKVKLGPVAVAFQGRAQLIEVNEAQHTVRVKASGNEAKGRGSAQAEVFFRLSADSGGARVDISSDLSLAGAVAQYGRAQSVITDLAQLMVDSFATNLGRRIAAQRPRAESSISASPEPAIVTSAPLSIFALSGALIRRWFARLKGNRVP
jgi:carbon monoxide dehydrogenase subunit G